MDARIGRRAGECLVDREKRRWRRCADADIAIGRDEERRGADRAIAAREVCDLACRTSERSAGGEAGAIDRKASAREVDPLRAGRGRGEIESREIGVAE